MPSPGQEIPPGFAAIAIELRHTLQARSAYLTWGCRIDGGIAVDTVPTATLVAVNQTGTGRFRDQLDTNVSILSCTARIGQDGGPPLVFVSASSLAGLSSNNTSPPNVALLFRKRSNRGGRRGRGRLFIPWVSTSATVDEAGKLSTIGFNNYSTIGSNLLTALAAANVPMVLLHTPSHDLKSGTGSNTGAPDLVTSITLDPLIATQRRRLGR